MSAFFVSKRTIDNVVMLAKPMHMTGDDAANEYGRKLWAMNVDALTQRYDLDLSEIDGMMEDVNGYTFTEHKDTSGAQLLKSLHCFTYQCSEGDVPERLLFKDMIKLEGITEEGLSKGRQRLRFGCYEPMIPGYDKAEWCMA